MTPDEQLELWLEGNPVHNEDRDECCPDFSCCRGDGYIASREVREIFVAAFRSGNTRVTDRLLMQFLSDAAAALTDKKVYVVGLEASRQEISDY